MTRRLQARLQKAGRSPEVHIYGGQDHLPDSVGENTHNELLLNFFSQHLN